MGFLKWVFLQLSIWWCGKKFIVCWCDGCLRDGELFLNCPLKKTFDPLIFPYLVFIGFCLNFWVELIVACWECKLGGEGLLWQKTPASSWLIYYICKKCKERAFDWLERFFSKINGSCHSETSFIIFVVYTAPNGYHYIIVLFGLDHEFYFILILFFYPSYLDSLFTLNLWFIFWN